MHPNRKFGWQDRDEMLAFLREIAFCTISIDGPFVMHAPVVVDPPTRLRFHIARGNRAAAALDGARAIVSCLGPDAYVSPDWYGTADQVPTWNYLAVEAEGRLRRLDEAGLVRLLDDLGADHEARLAPKPAWTRSKMSPGRFEGMLKAITGYELEIEDLRGTRKLGQNKSEAERLGAAEGLAPFHATIAEMMRASSSPSRSDGEGDHAKHGGGVAPGPSPGPDIDPSTALQAVPLPNLQLGRNE